MQPAAGLYDAVVETGGFVADGVDWLGKHNGLAAMADKFLDSMPRPPEWPDASGPVGGVLRTISTFIGAAYSPAKALKAYHWSVRGAGSAGVAGATGFPAEWENSATLIRDMADGNANMESAFSALPTSVQNLLKALPNMDERHPFYQRLVTGGVEAAFGIPFDALMTVAMTFRASREAKQLLKLDRSLASKKAEITGDFSVQPKLETDPDVAEFRKLQDNLQEAKANKNPQHIEQAEKRIQKFADKNPQGAAIASQPNLISDAGKGVLKSWEFLLLNHRLFLRLKSRGFMRVLGRFIILRSLLTFTCLSFVFFRVRVPARFTMVGSSASSDWYTGQGLGPSHPSLLAAYPCGDHSGNQGGVSRRSDMCSSDGRYISRRRTTHARSTSCSLRYATVS